MASNRKISEKALVSFQKLYPKADDVRWTEYSGGYVVYFTEDNIKCRVFYDEQGNITTSYRYYKAENLPPMIAGIITKRFEGKSIFGVTEIGSENSIVYELVLEDNHKWYHVRADAYGVCMMVEKFNKE